MKAKKILTVSVAMLMAVLLCITCAGCGNIGDYIDLIEDISGMYSQTATENVDNFENFDGDPYSITLYSDLSDEYSDMDPLFWVAEGEQGNKVYFLGSMHATDETAYRIPEKIMDAYEESDKLAVECDILAYESDTSAQYSDAMKMMYTDGSTIQDHLSEELYDAMVEYLEEYPNTYLTEYGYTVEMLNSFKPYMWSSIFDTYAIEESGLNYDLGIDYFFLNYATASGKEIVELESTEFQMDMLMGFSDELFEMMLWGSLYYSPEEQGEMLYDSYLDWKMGNPVAMLSERVLLPENYPEYSAEELEYYQALYDEYNTAMLTDRNIAMAEKAAEMIDNGENVFYIVGAAHMVDVDGVITLLGQRGYDVVQIGGMDASEYTGGVSYEHGTATTIDTDDDNNGTTTSTTTSTSVSDSEYDYDLYVEMYEHFGGTTAPHNTTTTTTTATTDKQTTEDEDKDESDNGYGGSGVFGCIVSSI